MKQKLTEHICVYELVVESFTQLIRSKQTHSEKKKSTALLKHSHNRFVQNILIQERKLL